MTSERFIHQVDQYDAWQRETIRHHGWALQAVLGEEESPPFVYTIGLYGFGHPELILFATSQATAATVLNDLGELVRGGRILEPGERVALPSGGVHLLAFPESEHWLYAAHDLYGGSVPAMLVVPADDLVETPGEDGCCAFCG